ncbi:MAG: glyoxalase/bleomycin resistance/dioxygenase family protein [Myxococcales bacterium]|mgnify:CR=1 FL=1|nr:glyoxalase/bleomycin resistance/dioxygenase family protein [Myxococcales bacterium]|tara:strand:- start:1376 stop:1798 length:423 start_codon:yes stop_codon:yes gene_type:complete
MIRLTHIAIQVRDLDASIDFYRDFCGMIVIHDRGQASRRVVWMAEPGREGDFIFVFMRGDARPPQAEKDYSHLGFALDSKAAVDELAEHAKDANCLVWAPRQEPFPVGYYCGIRDPDGYFIEFSYGQPIGPGADDYQHND